MGPENKQIGIVQELIRRIKEGIYEDKLPNGEEIAEEFAVNAKTANKAILRLAQMGLVIRRAKLGTFIIKDKTRLEDTLIELVFVGSTEMSTHPFYGEMWRGILDSLQDSIYRLVLNRLEENAEEGGLRQICKLFTPSAGKILVGTSNPEQIRQLKRHKVPLVLAGSKSSAPDVHCVYANTAPAIRQALRHLRERGSLDVAYIGLTRDNGELQLDLEKFHAYLAAVQEGGTFDSALIEHTPPLAHYGYDAMKNILARKKPQAVLLAYDHLCLGVYAAIREAGLSIPDDISVIGVDGISPSITPALTSIFVDRYEIGRQTGELMLDLIRTPSKRRTNAIPLEASFDPTKGMSIIT